MASSQIQEVSSLIKGAEGIAVFATVVLVVIGALLAWQYAMKEKQGFANAEEKNIWIAFLALAILGFVVALIYWAVLGAQNDVVGKTKQFIQGSQSAFGY